MTIGGGEWWEGDQKKLTKEVQEERNDLFHALCRTLSYTHKAPHSVSL